MSHASDRMCVTRLSERMCVTRLSERMSVTYLSERMWSHADASASSRRLQQQSGLGMAIGSRAHMQEQAVNRRAWHRQVKPSCIADISIAITLCVLQLMLAAKSV